jgi:hypothetical protein
MSFLSHLVGAVSRSIGESAARILMVVVLADPVLGQY